MTGDLPSATLTGNYQFLGGSAVPRLTATIPCTMPAPPHARGCAGRRRQVHISSRWGLRFDARVALSKAAANTDLDATPNVARLTPAGRGALGGTPSIQFSNNSTDPVTSMGVTAVAASSLTGPSLSGHRTFTGSGDVTGERDYRGVLAVLIGARMPCGDHCPTALLHVFMLLSHGRDKVWPGCREGVSDETVKAILYEQPR